MKTIYTALACAGLIYAAGASAQYAAPAAALVPAPEAPMLRVGTKVPLKLNEELTTKGKLLRVGQHFHMETTEPVLVNGQVVIPAGAPAMGEITEVRNKGMWGKSGHLTAQVSYVTVGSRQIRMTGTFDDKGTTGTAGVVAAVALVPVAGFFTTGTSAHIPVGAPVVGFVGEDVPLQTAAATPAPIVLPTATPGTSQPALVNASAKKELN